VPISVAQKESALELELVSVGYFACPELAVEARPAVWST